VNIAHPTAIRRRDFVHVAGAVRFIFSGLLLAASGLAQTTSIRLNAGGPAYTDSAGNTWGADTTAHNSFRTGVKIAGTADSALYQTEAYNAGTLEYQYPAANGQWNVTLKFAEIFFNGAGQRVFDILINGQKVQAAFDPFAAAGAAFTAIDETYPIYVTNNQIDIQLLPIVQNPKISAIDIEPSGALQANLLTSQISVIQAQIAALQARLASLQAQLASAVLGELSLPPLPAINYALQASDDLQTVIDGYANDPNRIQDVVITVPTYYVYTKHITLRNQPTNYWITVQSAYVFDPQVRVSPNDAANMPKLITPDSNAAIETDPTPPANGQHPGAAHHYRFSGFEITVAPGNILNYALVAYGTYKETDTADLPHDIEVENSYIHGGPGEMVRGIFMNGSNLTAKSNYIANIQSTFMEANAIYLGNVTSASNTLIENNYLSGAAETICIDCAGTSITNLTPGGITIRHNMITKDPAWRNASPAVFVKNLFECKNCQDVVLDSNVFENSWMQNQNGHAWVLIPRTQWDTEEWATVRRLTFENNIVVSVAAVVNMAGYDDQSTQPTAGRPISGWHTFKNNWARDVSGVKYANGYFAMGFQIDGPPMSITIDSNTTQFAPDDFAATARPPMGYWLSGCSTDLRGATFNNNVFGAELGGDCRYGPGSFVGQPPNTTVDPQQPNTPGVFNANNVIAEGNSYWQQQWSTAVPGGLFAPTPTSGANIANLTTMEAQVRAGTYQ
jgi:hypothetical protein